ncbi:Reverse transcriptase domain-containing protein [Aphis craccivora]|uniref:Reverse transcriptase domain-containing protein n=1 Tax=Aphis craccivora TaxID=307492 RepID=A0A6G0ZIA8_APHCR|nr:Reverse transcriptase domain-containing protein [Aphis craccivora]
MECDNYRDISLLNTAYKIFSKILLKRLLPYVDENIGSYQCDFRKGKSTIDQLSIIGQIIEKRYEYRQNIWQLFIDFKKRKLIKLVKLCMENTQYTVRVDNTMSTPFTVDTGLKKWKNSTEKTFYALLKFLNSKTLSRRSKMRLYVSVIRPTLTYGCEAWTTTVTTEKRLRTFENRIWRKICGTVFDTNVGCWRRRFNRELQEIMNLSPVTSFIKGQTIQWLGRILRREENDHVRVAFEWKPKGKRPRGHSRKRWIDGVAEDLKEMGIEDWRVIAQDREKWRDIVVTAKTLRESLKSYKHRTSITGWTKVMSTTCMTINHLIWRYWNSSTTTTVTGTNCYASTSCPLIKVDNVTGFPQCWPA